MPNKKSISLLLAATIMLTLSACGNNQGGLPFPAPDRFGNNSTDISDQERSALAALYENPSVKQAEIENNLSGHGHIYEYYSIDLDKATASIVDTDRTVFTYELDEVQVEQLNRLLSEYTLTVYDDKPYWPTGDYATMIQLFEYDIIYKDGHFNEYGATHYPTGWDEFIQDLRSLITKEQAPGEISDADVWNGTYEYRGYIGNDQVHMSLVIDDTQVLGRKYFTEEAQPVSGEYVYADVPEPISLSGYMKGNCLYLTDTSGAGAGTDLFVALRESDGSLKGIRQGNGQEQPCYLEETGGESQAGSKPAMEWEQPPELFSGYWYGTTSDYYKYSQIRFVPLYDELVYFKMNAADGNRNGDLEGIGRYDGAQLSFTADKVVFTFRISENEDLELDSNNYHYRCHPAVAYDMQYERRADGLVMPETLDFLTPEQNEQLKELTGERYDSFLAAAQTRMEVDFSGSVADLMMHEFGLRGAESGAYVLIRRSDGYMSAGLNYFNKATNRAELLYFEDQRDDQIWELVNSYFGSKEIVVQD